VLNLTSCLLYISRSHFQNLPDLTANKIAFQSKAEPVNSVHRHAVLLRWPWPWPDDLGIYDLDPDMPKVYPQTKKWTFDVKDFEIWSQNRIHWYTFSHLWPWPLTYKHDLDILKMCLHAKVNVLDQGFQKLRVQTGHTDAFFYPCDLDLDPMTSVLELDLDNPELYLHFENELFRSRLSTVTALQTDISQEIPVHQTHCHATSTGAKNASYFS